MTKIHQKGIDLQEDELARLKESAEGQQETITAVLQKSEGLTAFEIQDIINEYDLSKSPWPITSIRRALTNMDNDPASQVEKTAQKRKGRYGIDVHVYQFQEPVQVGQGDMFGTPKPKSKTYSQ